MPESPIRKLVPFAENAKAKGIEVIHLNIGQPDIKTPQIALDAVSNAKIEVLAYSRTEGSDTYRDKLAQYYKLHHVNITKEDIIVTTGGSKPCHSLWAVWQIQEMRSLFQNPFTPTTMGLQLPTILE